MGFITRFIPTPGSLYQRRGKIAGLLTGVFGTLALGAFASVLATGHPIDLGPPPPVQVYTNF
ncbi:MAG: hypothetical protein AAGA06_12575 [Pseudomonadota bacterium]